MYPSHVFIIFFFPFVVYDACTFFTLSSHHCRSISLHSAVASFSPAADDARTVVINQPKGQRVKRSSMPMYIIFSRISDLIPNGIRPMGFIQVLPLVSLQCSLRSIVLVGCAFFVIGQLFFLRPAKGSNLVLSSSGSAGRNENDYRPIRRLTTTTTSRYSLTNNAFYYSSAVGFCETK